MSDTFSDFVIQISTSPLEPDTAGTRVGRDEDNRLIAELRHCLRPGVDIALVFEGYVAMTSILWLSDLQGDGSICARVRLRGVSALANGLKQSGSPAQDGSRTLSSLHLDCATIGHQS